MIILLSGKVTKNFTALQYHTYGILRYFIPNNRYAIYYS